jgi:hypothetical protein
MCKKNKFFFLSQITINNKSSKNFNPWQNKIATRKIELIFPVTKHFPEKKSIINALSLFLVKDVAENMRIPQTKKKRHARQIERNRFF